MSALRICIAAIILVAGAACAKEEPPPTSSADLPTWLDRVYPPPGSDALPVASVQIRFDPDFLEPKQNVRLILDGTDVTAYADVNPGRIVYDPKDGPVKLRAGRHDAEVRRVEQPEFGEKHRVLDKYSWSFEFR